MRGHHFGQARVSEWVHVVVISYVRFPWAGQTGGLRAGVLLQQSRVVRVDANNVEHVCDDSTFNLLVEGTGAHQRRRHIHFQQVRVQIAVQNDIAAEQLEAVGAIVGRLMKVRSYLALRGDHRLQAQVEYSVKCCLHDLLAFFLRKPSTESIQRPLKAFGFVVCRGVLHSRLPCAAASINWSRLEDGRLFVDRVIRQVGELITDIL